MFSITGEHDHTPFGSGGAQLVWGQRADGSLVHISKAERGKKCDCVCPACELGLLAKKGPKLAEHFAHLGGTACAGVRETNAHIWAKEILAARKQIWIPAVIAESGRKRREEYRARLLDFESAELEKRDGSIVPDVKLVYRDANGRVRELIVEILVTHACDAVKIAKIRAQGTSAVEIDLSGLRRADSEDVVAVALIGADATRRAPREWLFNPKVDRANDRLAADLARVAAEHEAKLALAARARQTALLREAEMVVKAASSIKPVSTDATLEDHEIVGLYGLGDFVGLPIEARGFRVPQLLWQSAIVSRVVIERISSIQSGILAPITPKSVCQALHDCLVANVPSDPGSEIREAVLSRQPGFVFPADAVEKYLTHLEANGILRREKFWTGRTYAAVGWSLSSAAEVQFSARKVQLGERYKRDERARIAIGSIVERVPNEERGGFSLDRWYENIIPEFGVRLSDLVETGGTGWAKLDNALYDIVRMLRGGAPVATTLGLPIAGEITRATERERAKREETDRQKREAEEKLVRDRAAWLTQQATDALGWEAGRLWLDQILPGGTRLAVAAASESGFSEGQRTLATERQARLDQARRDKEAADCRRQLETAASKAFDQETHAKLFMSSTQPRLGMSPWNRCTDGRGLDECLALLPGRAAQRPTRAGRR